ncbi:MAG: DUF3052 domain-containing protein [Acidobacteriota bacterium]
MAGYSGTPLARKLGIKPGHRVALINAPPGFEGTLAPLPESVAPRSQARGVLDVIVFFTDREAVLRRRFEKLARHLAADGGLWIGWPKKASGAPTDLAFDVVQSIGLGAGLVDNKVCAIDDTYSGLRFVVRVEDRDNWPPVRSGSRR